VPEFPDKARKPYPVLPAVADADAWPVKT
jgi:hypothetical protein